LEHRLNVVNVYGPCQKRGPYRDKIFSKSVLKDQQVILGGDLKFSLVFSEVWATHVKEDPLTSFFSQKMVECNVLDIEPIKPKPNQRNNRVGVITLKCTTQVYLASGQLMPLPSQRHAEQILKKPLKTSNPRPNFSLGAGIRLLSLYCTRASAG
jgi:hypothetical protein